MTSDYAIVGAPGAKKAFIFAYDSSSETWSTTAVATIDGYTSETNFGFNIAMTSDYAIVGAYGAKKAFIFAYDSSSETWSTTAVATIDGYTSEANFGFRI